MKTTGYRRSVEEVSAYALEMESMFKDIVRMHAPDNAHDSCSSIELLFDTLYGKLGSLELSIAVQLRELEESVTTYQEENEALEQDLLEMKQDFDHANEDLQELRSYRDMTLDETLSR